MFYFSIHKYFIIYIFYYEFFINNLVNMRIALIINVMNIMILKDNIKVLTKLFI